MDFQFSSKKMLSAFSFAWFVIAMKERCRWIPIVIKTILSKPLETSWS